MGRPKAWLDAWGEPLLTRTVRTVSQVCTRVVVVAAPGQELPAVPSRIVRDAVEGEGPLRGLEAGLDAINSRAAFICAVDVPFLQREVIQFLAESLGQAQAAIPRWEGREHPLQAVYGSETLPLIRELLGQGKRRPANLLARIPVRYVEEEEIRRVDPGGLSFFNANTPEDWAAVLQRGSGAE